MEKVFINKTVIRGIVGNVRTFTAGGKTGANISVITRYAYKNREGQDVAEDTWHRITAWERAGIADLSKIAKGMWIEVQGRRTDRRYTDADGNERIASEVQAATLYIIKDED